MVLGGGETFGPDRRGLLSERRGWRYWRRLSLTAQFLIVATLIVGGSMFVLSQWLSSQIAAGQVRSRAESGALYMQGFLAPHVQQLVDGPTVTEADRSVLDGLLIGTDLAERVEGMRIYRSDGTVIYSTSKSLQGKRVPSADIDLAFSGRVVAQLEMAPDDEEDDAKRLFDYPLLEIYAPIYRLGSHEIVAVGEFYEEAALFIAQVDGAQRGTWGVPGGLSARRRRRSWRCFSSSSGGPAPPSIPSARD